MIWRNRVHNRADQMKNCQVYFDGESPRKEFEKDKMTLLKGE